MINEFDQKAAAWDANPMHLERSRAIAEKLMETMPLRKEMTALEFGAGTGLLSLLLGDRFTSVTMLDSSAEMVRIIRDKLAASKISHMKALVVDLEKEDFKGSFDILYSQMALHHVTDLDLMLDKFHGLLKPGGLLALADLCREDGSFHEEPFTGHHGFDPEALSARLADRRFTDLRHQTCFVIRKMSELHGPREYPVFLLTARRS